MISQGKVQSVLINAGNRIVKLLGWGKDDMREIEPAAPAGVDSAPVAKLIAVYADTGNKGEPVVIGYLNVNQLAEPGEVRLYSTDADGTLQTYVWCKADGKILLGGDSNHVAQYEGLETAYNALKDDVNQLKQLIAAWIPVASDGGAKLKSDLLDWYTSPVTADITAAKLDDILTT